MEGVLQDLAGVGSGASHGRVARFVSEKNELFCKNFWEGGKQGAVASSRLPAEEN